MKLIIADDHPIFRNGLKTILETSFKGCTITECSDGNEALSKIIQVQPDISILDINMPGINGIVVTKKVRSINPSARIIILTMYREKEMVKKAISSGASGYILKDFAANEIIECINKVLDNKTYIGPALRTEESQIVFETSKDNASGLLSNLNQAEIKILKLVNQNKSSREIAELLFLSEKTVENYRSKICQKLGLPPRNNSLMLWVSEHKDLLTNINEF